MSDNGYYQQYELYKQRRDTLVAIVRDQERVARSLDMKTWPDSLPRIEERLLSDCFKVLVLGEFKRGKSTFINAMLGAKVLPAYAKPCTAIINEIRWGDQPRALLFPRADGDGKGPKAPPEPMEIPVEQIAQYVVIKDDVNEVHESPYEKVQLFWPLELCRQGVELIDSPGLNESEIRQKITMNYLSTVDAILFVLTAEQLASQGELDVIENNVKSLGHEDLFFICNRWDQIVPEEREELKKWAFYRLADKTKRGRDGIYFVSARDALDGRLAGDAAKVTGSGVPPLEKDLEDFLANQRGRLKLLQPARELKACIRAARNTIPSARSMLQMNLQEIEARYADAQEPLRQLERQRQQMIQRIANDRQDVRHLTAEKARRFYDGLSRKIPEWVAQYKIQKAVGFGDTLHMEAAVKRVVEEIGQYLTKKIEGEFAAWQKQEVQPFLETHLEQLAQELNDQAREFLKKVDVVREGLAPGAGVSQVAVEVDGTRVSPLERVISATGGFLIGGIGSAALGGMFGYKEMLKSLIPQIAIGLAVTIFAGFNPWILVPALLAGGGIQSLIKGQSVNEKIKAKVVEQYTGQVVRSGPAQADDMAAKVSAKLEEIEKAVDEGLNREIQGVREQVQAMLAAKQSGQADVDAKLQQLAVLSDQLEAVDGQLDDLISQVALS